MLSIWLNRSSLALAQRTVNRNFATRFFDCTNNGVRETIQSVVGLETANQQQKTKFKIQNAIKSFQKHDGDTGNSSVQIAIMTEKILNFVRHAAAHKKDKASVRGFQILVARRRKMMQYLKRKNVDEFNELVRSLGLKKEASQI